MTAPATSHPIAIAADQPLLPAILDTVDALVVVLDAEGRIELFNRACERATGYAQEEVRGRAIWDMLLVPEEVDAVRGVFSRLRAGDFPVRFENRWRNKDGSQLWVVWSNTALTGRDGRVEHVVGTGIDLTARMGAERALRAARQDLEGIVQQRTSELLATVEALRHEMREREQAERELRESEERLRTSQQIAGVGLWEWNLADGSMFWSDEVYRIFGLSPLRDPPNWETLMARTHPEDVESVIADLRGLLDGEAEYDRDQRLLRPEGDERHIHVRARVARDGQGRALRLVAAVHDVTERRLTERALSEQKERAEVTLRCIGDAVITTDAAGRVQTMNPIAEALTGWSEDDARDLPVERVLRLVHEETRQALESPLTRCLEGGEVVHLRTSSLLVSRSGQEYAIEDSAAPIRDRDGRLLGAVMVFHDVSQQRRMAREIAFQASHDALTGLTNRREFELRLARALSSSKERGARHALCYMDLDQFKIVNDTVGHAAGDQLLRQVTVLLQEAVRERDTLARLGGDEFGLLLDNCPLDKAYQIAEGLTGTVRDFRFAWEGRSFQIGVSIGLVPVTAEARDTGELLAQADVACYTAKEMGRNRVHVYQLEEGEPPRRHTEMLRATELRAALEQDRFSLFVQPIVPLAPRAGEAPLFEVLLRLRDDQGRLVYPGAFIPPAERFGLMGEIDRWVIREALRALPRATQLGPGACIGINLSGNSLNDEGLVAYVGQELEEAGVAPQRVCFEIAELACFQNLPQAASFIAGVRALGCRLALDDFGSGVSSLPYVKKMPLDFVKISGGFMRELPRDAVDQAMVEAINSIAHRLGIRTIAECADSAEVVEALRRLGVDYGQGYGLGRPAPLLQG